MPKTRTAGSILALHISYPTAADTETARKLGSRPGGAIMIHGLASSFAYLGPLHRQTDWTDGCIAVTNAEIEEIWRLVRGGNPRGDTAIAAGSVHTAFP